MTEKNPRAGTIRTMDSGPKTGAWARDLGDAAPVGAYVGEIDEREGRWSVLHGRDRFRHVVQGATTSVMAKVGMDEYELIRIAPEGITLRTWHAGCFPVFYRAVPRGVRLSNHPHLLFHPGETVEVKAQVVAQRITAHGLQVYNPFTTVERLEDSAEYRLRGSGFVRSRSLFAQDPHASWERVRQMLLRWFHAYVREARPIAVPLSGGHDSRLILACLRAVAGNAGRARVHAYHEYKSNAERAIALQAAEQCQAPISHFRRDDLPERISSLSRDPEFILQAGLGKRVCLRWSVHIGRMREQQGGDVRVIGLASDPCKGQYYRQIEDLERDTLRVFAPRSPRLDTGLSHLGLSGCEDFYTPLLHSTLERSREVYDCRTSRLDFVFYHVQVCNNRGNRTRYYFDQFDMHFPRHDHDFMNLAFSLPRSEKEAAMIPRRLIADIDKELARIPYISGNAKSLAPRPNLYRRAAASISRRIRPPIKGRKAKGDLVDHEPGSALTAALKTSARSTHPLIGQADAIIAYNYFSTLEQRLGIGYRLV